MPTDLIKILLHDDGEDVESVWARTMPSPAGRTFARLDNIPFVHAKPTFGDVIEVSADESQPGFLCWNVRGCTYDEIVARLVEDGGKYAAIVDFECVDPSRFAALVQWSRTRMALEWEGARGPAEGRPGRAYLAVDYADSVAAMMKVLEENPLGFRFTLVHPVSAE
mgnify:CR=1 FL=1|jgi:hypothetical protein